MSNLDQLIERYHQFIIKKLGRNDVDELLLRQIAKSLGPAIFSNDGSKVACSDNAELARIKSSFLIDQLGLKDEPTLDLAIKEVCIKMGKANRNKYRAVFYYLLVEKFGKQATFKTASTRSESESILKDNHEEDAGQSEEAKHSDRSDSSESIEDIIHHYALYAAGAGLIPIPMIDLASISAIQYAMIKKMASHYPHVEFHENRAKSLVMAILGGVGSFQLGIVTRWLMRGIPFIGPIIGGTAMAGFAYLSTRLIGDIFNDHFESGGDLKVEDITLQKMKDTFLNGLDDKTKYS